MLQLKSLNPLHQIGNLGHQLGKAMHLGSKSRWKSPGREVLTNFIEGCQSSYDELYRRFHQPVFVEVSRKIRNETIAEEVTQEIFLKVFRYHASYKLEYEFSTWLWTIMRNSIYDHLRSGQCPSNVPAGHHDDGEGPVPADEIPCGKDGIEKVLMDRMERRSLRRVFRRMPRAQRKAILLRTVRCLSYQEIAKSMDLSLAAVKSLINRGKTSMIEIFESENFVASMELETRLRV